MVLSIRRNDIIHFIGVFYGANTANVTVPTKMAKLPFVAMAVEFGLAEKTEITILLKGNITI